MTKVVDVAEKMGLLEELWSPRIVARVDGHDVKVARIEGAFEWHQHPDADELFLVVAGDLEIELRDGSVRLGPGQLTVIPAGVEHRPVAHGECQIVLVERAGTLNTGANVGSRRAVHDPGWI